MSCLFLSRNPELRCIGVPLNQIAAEKSTTTEIVFALIQWAEAEGRIPELLQAAVKANSGNVALQEFAAQFGDLSLGESNTQARQGESKMMQSQRDAIAKYEVELAGLTADGRGDESVG